VQHDAARSRQLDTPLRALEQPDTDFGFELEDLLAERRLKLSSSATATK
jgi:hypothetical protein